MANVPYRKLPDNSSYIQQVGNAGGPLGFKIQINHDDGLWYIYASADLYYWWPNPNPTPYSTQAAAQTALDQYISLLNAGTA